MTELSTCEFSHYYYVDYLMKMDDESINTLNLEVDRGVDFDTLAYLLESFPNLKSLVLNQNYSTSTIDEFYEFIRKTKLTQFILIDSQSEFLKFLKIKDLITHLPENANYKIKYGEEDIFLKYKQNNKLLELIGDFNI